MTLLRHARNPAFKPPDLERCQCQGLQIGAQASFFRHARSERVGTEVTPAWNRCEASALGQVGRIWTLRKRMMPPADCSAEGPCANLPSRTSTVLWETGLAVFALQGLLGHAPGVLLPETRMSIASGSLGRGTRLAGLPGAQGLAVLVHRQIMGIEDARIATAAAAGIDVRLLGRQGHRI
jgi:hypothetical protein